MTAYVEDTIVCIKKWNWRLFGCAVVLKPHLPSPLKCTSLSDSKILFYRKASLGYELGFIKMFLELVLKT